MSNAGRERDSAFLVHMKKKVIPITNQIEDVKDRFPTNANLALLVNLAMEGGRELSLHKPFTAVDVMEKAHDHVDGLRCHLMEMVALVEQLEAAMREADVAYNKLYRCPLCKGDGGWTSPTEGKDCPRCQGRGTI